MISDFCGQTCESKLMEQDIIWNLKIKISDLPQEFTSTGRFDTSMLENSEPDRFDQAMQSAG